MTKMYHFYYINKSNIFI